MKDKSDGVLTRKITRRPVSRWLMACALALTLVGVAPSVPAADGPSYRALRIVSPLPDASIRNNRGTVRVVVQLAPPLRVDQGDRLTLWLDGQATAQITGTEFLLTQVDRGTHTVQVQIEAENGAMLIQSEAVVFHLHQASRLVPRRNH